MGEDYVIVHVDKRQRLHPATLGLASSLGQLLSAADLPRVLMWLLVDRQPLVFSDSPLCGSWIGDRVVVAGDCGPSMDLHALAVREFEEITIAAFEAMVGDQGLIAAQSEERGMIDADWRFIPEWGQTPPA